MNITSIEGIPVAIDIKSVDEELGVAPYRGRGDRSHDSITRMLVRIETDVGVVGWGETGVLPAPKGWSGDVDVAKSIIEDVVAPEVVGHPIDGFEALADAFEISDMDLDRIQGALDVAMWDALGKHLEQPVYSFLGGKVMDDVPVAHCVGVFDPDRSRTLAREALEAGFDTLKTKATADWRQAAARVTAMHDAADGQLDLRVDPNQAWSPGDATRLGAELEDAGIYLQYIEQPTRVDTFGTYKRLRQRLRQPIAINEDTYFRHHLTHLAKEDAIDVGVVDLVPSRGITGVKKVAAVAEEANISLSHHSSFDFGIKVAAVMHTIASTPAIDLPPDRANHTLVDDVIETRFTATDGRYRVPDGPGLGITVDEAKIEEYRVD